MKPVMIEAAELPPAPPIDYWDALSTVQICAARLNTSDVRLPHKERAALAATLKHAYSILEPLL